MQLFDFDITLRQI